MLCKNDLSMKVSGFTFVRNAIKYDFPVVEAIKSILPICDDFYVAVGKSEDQTLDLIRSIDPKIKILETIWDDTIQEGGRVLALETNKALKMIPENTDWCIYVQGDEVVHEKYLDPITEAMHKWKDHPEVDGLLLNYLHFFGSYDYITTSTTWYRKEIRVIRNDPSIYSYKDAQGFRKGNNNKLRVKPVDAYIYHYGFVKHPKTQFEKRRNSLKFYDPEKTREQYQYKVDEFDYGSVDLLEKFSGTHPEVIKGRIAKKNWHFDPDLSVNNMILKHRFKKWVEDHFGFVPFEYRNYKII